MTKSFALAAALAAALLSTAAQADAPKAMHGKMMSGKKMASGKMASHGKMVSLYQADKCHMYFTPAQAKKYSYACPDSHGKMKMVKVSSAVAKAEIAKTNAALAPKKAM
jgi:hypothetical protein